MSNIAVESRAILRLTKDSKTKIGLQKACSSEKQQLFISKKKTMNMTRKQHLTIFTETELNTYSESFPLMRKKRKTLKTKSKIFTMKRLTSLEDFLTNSLKKKSTCLVSQS